MARLLISDVDERRSRWDIAPNSYVSRHLSHMEHMERVTGIEPALSAWEPT